MISEQYRRQVALLSRVLPIIALHECFALHGGTAINLYLRELPRLSVDIDLTYIPLLRREEALQEIGFKLQILKKQIEKELHGVKVSLTETSGYETKLFCKSSDTQVKVEVNLVMRGLIGPFAVMPMSRMATEFLQFFNEMKLTPQTQLFGGKVCAALDRQHPRDFFDLYISFLNKESVKNWKDGIIYALLSSNRPLNELLNPRFKDQRGTFANQFAGMARLPFSYNMFELTREWLIEEMANVFTDEDKSIMLRFIGLELHPEEYAYYDYPSIQWKMSNLSIFKDRSPKQYYEQLDKLKAILIV